MKFYQKLDGGTQVSAREYDVAKNTAIAEGQLVWINSGLVEPVGPGQTDPILGVAAENHSGAADALDPRANGTKILVIDDPGAVYQCAAPTVTAKAGGTAATIAMESGSLAAALETSELRGGYVQLVSKAEDSANADAVGTVRRITAYDGGAQTLTVESGGTAAAGDVYAVYPPVGFHAGWINPGRTALILTKTTSNLALVVVGHDRGLGRLNLAARAHLFAGKNA